MDELTGFMELCCCCIICCDGMEENNNKRTITRENNESYIEYDEREPLIVRGEPILSQLPNKMKRN